MFLDRLGAAWLDFQARERESVRLLVIDDEPSVCLLFSELMTAAGYSVDTAETIEGAVALLDSPRYQLIVVDKNLPDGSGIELLRDLRRAGDQTPVVVVTGYPSAETVVDALTAGAADYISKPFEDVSLVMKRLESVIDDRMSHNLNERMVQDLGTVLETDGPDQEQVARVASRLFGYKRELSERPSVLVVEDNLAVAEVVRRSLSASRLSVEVATDLRAAKAWVQRGDGPLAALVSVDLSEALEMVTDLHEMDPLLEIVVTTGSTDTDLALGAVAGGAVDYVLRPFEGIDILRRRMQRAVARGRRRRLYLHLITTLYQEAKRAGSEAMDRLMAMLPALDAPARSASSSFPEPASSIIFPDEVDLSDLFSGEAELEAPLSIPEPPAPAVCVKGSSDEADSRIEEDERRRHKRVEAGLEVRFQPITEEGHGIGDLVFSHLRDISAGGMFIVMDSPFPIGTRLAVELDLGWGLDTVELVCEVVRRVAPEQPLKARAGIGVRFEADVENEVKRLIANLAGRIVPV